LIRDAEGNFYGTTQSGGAHGYSTVFELHTTGELKVLYSFVVGVDGLSPQAGVIRDSAGNLYGTTYFGGGSKNCRDLGHRIESCGTVFQLSKTGKLTVLHNFAGAKRGFYPTAPVIRDAEGNLYGTAESGNGSDCSLGCGLVFELTQAGKYTVLHTFTGSDGATPYAGLVQDAAGNLYGTTVDGGSGVCSCGVIFRIKP
jgi:uncharacterized repeat protein (TIGR03803 family)